MSKLDSAFFASAVEAIVLASPEPIPARKIAGVIEEATSAEVARAIAALNERYADSGSSFRIRELAGGYQFYIMPEYVGFVEELFARRRKLRLTRAALETVAIIAYRQPVTKADPLQDPRRIQHGLVVRHAGEGPCNGHVLLRRHGRDQVEGLEDHPDARPQFPERGVGGAADFGAVHPDRTGGDGDEPVDGAEQRALPRAGMSDQTDHLTGSQFGDFKSEICQPFNLYA